MAITLKEYTTTVVKKKKVNDPGSANQFIWAASRKKVPNVLKSDILVDWGWMRGVIYGRVGT